MMNFIQTKEKSFIKNGKPVHFTGVNFGNWLLLEHFMIGMPQVEENMHKLMKKHIGEEQYRVFIKTYRDNYITEKDFRFLDSLKVNLIRLPFNYKLFVKEDHVTPDNEAEGFKYLDKAVELADKYNMYILFDMHAAPGAQALDWNADCTNGESRFWTERHCRDLALDIWKMIVKRYKDKPAVFGYEPLNEPVSPDKELLYNWYHQFIKEVRSIDPHHIISLEANMWGKDAAGFDNSLFEYPNICYQPHFYAQHFHSIENAKADDDNWTAAFNLDDIACSLGTMTNDDINAPVLIGETGLQREESQGPYRVYSDVLKLYNKRNYSWTLWTYKDIGGMGFMNPDKKTAWMRIVKGEKWLEKKKKIDSIFLQTFKKDKEHALTYKLIKEIFPGITDDSMYHVLKEVRRQAELLALEGFMDIIKDRTPQKMEELAMSFHYDNCTPHPPALQMIKAGLDFDFQPGFKSELSPFVKTVISTL